MQTAAPASTQRYGVLQQEHSGLDTIAARACRCGGGYAFLQLCGAISDTSNSTGLRLESRALKLIDYDPGDTQPLVDLRDTIARKIEIEQRRIPVDHELPLIASLRTGQRLRRRQPPAPRDRARVEDRERAFAHAAASGRGRPRRRDGWLVR